MTNVDVFDKLAFVAERVRKCPTVTLRRAYVRAMRDWCAQTRWLRTTIAGATVANTQLYDLGSDPYVEIVAITEMSGVSGNLTPPQIWALRAGIAQSWNPNINTSQPQEYAYVPEGQFSLYPVPDAVYNLTVVVVLQPKDGAVQVPAAPLVKYSSDIEAGALSVLLSMKGMPWYDAPEAMRQDKIFRSGINNAKADAQRLYQSGSQRATPRRFLY